MSYHHHIMLNHRGGWNKDDFVFFWGHTQKGDTVTKACFSQWYLCRFVVDGVTYNCAEQYMMAEKARIFGDEEVRRQILHETDQMTIKKLGRKVANYDDDVWCSKRFDVVIAGNIAKFSQNPQLQEFLLNTGDKVLVEASPKDKIWGIGLDEFNPSACDPDKWQGRNLLGFALMDVRQHLRERYEQARMHEQFVRYFETVAELHKLGYERFRVCAYIGLSYRCCLTVRQNCWRENGLFCNIDDQEFALITLNCKLPWDSLKYTAHENALRIIQEFPELSRYALGRDQEYVKWFKLALDECRKEHYIYAFDDYYNSLREGYTLLCGVDGKGLPLPPVGDCETESMY